MSNRAMMITLRKGAFNEMYDNHHEFKIRLRTGAPTWEGLMWREIQRPEVAREGSMAAVGRHWHTHVMQRGRT